MTGSERFKAGIDAAVEALRQADADAFVLDRAEQLELLPGGQKLVTEAGRRCGPGRPKGSRNRATADLAAALGAQFGHAVIELARRYAFVPVEVLAARLKCDVLEAAEINRKALEKVAEYQAMKMPTALDLTGAPPAVVVFAGDPALIQAAAGVDPAALPEVILVDGEVVENQGVGAAATAELEEGELEERAEREADQ